MKVSNENFALKFLENLSDLSKTQKIVQSSDGEFEKELEILNLQAKSSLKNMDVNGFRQNLTKMGAVKFMSYMNELKIEEKIQAKRAELIKTLGLDEESVRTKSPNEIKELLAMFEDMIEKFKKDLLAKMQDNSLLEKQQKLSKRRSPLSFALNIV